jgi:hypothetical protein
MVFMGSLTSCGLGSHPDPRPTARDDIRVVVHVRLANDEETFRASVVGQGVPPKEDLGMPPDAQAVVVKLDWSDSAAVDGWFHLIAFDERVWPPRPLAGEGSWSAAGLTGSQGSSAYDALARRYDWLASLGSMKQPNGSVTRKYSTPAVIAPASRVGTVTAWWFNWVHADDNRPLTDAADLVFALIYETPGGHLQWVTQIKG